MTNIKWQYADHWRTYSPQGPINQFASRREMDRFLKQISAVGLSGIGMFAWNLGAVSAMFGSLQELDHDRGLVAIESFYQTLLDTDYEAWVVESDQSGARIERDAQFLVSAEQAFEAGQGVMRAPNPAIDGAILGEVSW